MSSLLSRFQHNAELLKKKVVGRESLIDCILKAILTRSHVLVIGKPGTAKSMLAREVFKAFTDSNRFAIACTKRMSEEYLVGPLNMPLFRDKGEYRHMTDGTLVDADFAFIDEFLDLPDQCARALLEILNERTFTRGKQRETSPLCTAIACTNFTAESEALEAVEDRFMFRAKVNPLNDVDDIKKVLTLKEKGKYKRISLNDLRTIQQRVHTVRIHEEVISLYAEFVVLCRSAGLVITDRRVVQALPILKAHAYIDGRDSVKGTDLMCLESVFAYLSDDKQLQKFASACAKISGQATELDDCLQKWTKCEEHLFSLSFAVDEAGAKGNVRQLITEVQDFISALTNDPSIKDRPATENLVATARQLLTNLKKK